MDHMETKNTHVVLDWLKRFNNIERSDDQLIHSENTTQKFCVAIERTSMGTTFKREPNEFYAHLHKLAPKEMKNE